MEKSSSSRSPAGVAGTRDRSYDPFLQTPDSSSFGVGVGQYWRLFRLRSSAREGKSCGTQDRGAILLGRSPRVKITPGALLDQRSIYQCDRRRAGKFKRIACSRRECWTNVAEDYRLDRARERDSYDFPLLDGVAQQHGSKNQARYQ